LRRDFQAPNPIRQPYELFGDRALRLLVTGGAGRLGSELVKSLVREGYKVRVFDLPQANYEAVEALDKVEILKGSITSPAEVREAVKGVQGIFHLAALLPHRSELNRAMTMLVNVEGSRNISNAARAGNHVPMVFPSSAAVYGITADEEPPISINHPLEATDLYSESKIRGEEIVRESGCPYVILRISGVYAVELVDPPPVIPFKSDQRVEFINLGDAVNALKAAYENIDAYNRVFNISGGKSWQMSGEVFLKELYAQFNFFPKLSFSDSYTWLDWYDTDESQRALIYQSMTFSTFLKNLRILAGTLVEQRRERV